MANDIIEKIYELCDKIEWLPVSIARYLIEHDIDMKSIPEFAC